MLVRVNRAASINVGGCGHQFSLPSLAYQLFFPLLFLFLFFSLSLQFIFPIVFLSSGAVPDFAFFFSRFLLLSSSSLHESIILFPTIPPSFIHSLIHFITCLLQAFIRLSIHSFTHSFPNCLHLSTILPSLGPIKGSRLATTI
ncbi:hypothetical protein V8C42DRAFT_334267, partial [Trichoderma barbatum]